MNTQLISHVERLAAAKQHLVLADRDWPSLADNCRPSLAWSQPAAADLDDPDLVKLAISWTG